MNINIPEQARGILYVICGLGSVLVTYLAATATIGVEEVSLWTGFTAFISLLARFNLSPSANDQQGGGK